MCLVVLNSFHVVFSRFQMLFTKKGFKLCLARVGLVRLVWIVYASFGCSKLFHVFFSLFWCMLLKLCFICFLVFLGCYKIGLCCSSKPGG